MPSLRALAPAWTRRRRAALGAALALPLSLAVAAPSQAGIYEHWSINGESAATANMDGWEKGVRHNGEGYVGVHLTPHAHQAWFVDRRVFTPGERADIGYFAPANTRIVGWRIETATNGLAGGDWNTHFETNNSGFLPGSQAPSANGYADFGWGQLNAAWTRVSLLCNGPTNCYGDGTANLGVFKSLHQLADDAAPTTSSPQGDLVNHGTLKGAEALSFNASDRGSGVYMAHLEVDGRVVSSQLVHANGGACQDIRPGDGWRQFGARVPCKLDASPTLSFDTSTAPEGSHRISVKVEDASGNETTVYGPHTKLIDNVPAPANTAQPTVGGPALEGRTLSASAGTWSGAGVSLALRWERGSGASWEAIPHATTRTYTLTNEDVGKRVRLRVTATNAEGSSEATSEATGIVAPTGATDRDGDFDHDGDPNHSDPDDDNDGVLDGEDPAPFDPMRTGREGAGGANAGGRPGTGGTTPGAPAQPAPVGPPSNGVNASQHAKVTVTGQRTRTVAYGRRIATVGRLSDEHGRPIANAEVSVLERAFVPKAGPMRGADWEAAGTTRTDRRGTFRFLIPAKHSRTVRFGYKARTQDRDLAAASEVTLLVSSKATLAVDKARVRNGQRIAFSGRLLAGPVPVTGVLLDLQARTNRGWVTFKVARARANGRYAASYRFTKTFRTQAYRFRAQVRQDSTYPYLPSTTNQVQVRVRGGR